MTESFTLPTAAPARVLACGAFLKNRAARLEGDRLAWSAVHGDLGDAEACRALDASAEALLDPKRHRGVNDAGGEEGGAPGDAGAAKTLAG